MNVTTRARLELQATLASSFRHATLIYACFVRGWVCISACAELATYCAGLRADVVSASRAERGICASGRRARTHEYAHVYTRLACTYSDGASRPYVPGPGGCEPAPLPLAATARRYQGRGGTGQTNVYTARISTCETTATTTAKHRNTQQYSTHPRTQERAQLRAYIPADARDRGRKYPRDRGRTHIRGSDNV